MPDFNFSVVQRPHKAASLLPPRLIEAIDKTVSSGQAVRIDTTGWTQTRIKTVYQGIFKWSKGAAYNVHRRRGPGEIYVWGVRK